MHEPSANQAMNELEQMLAGLRPTPVHLERDKVLFRAGQESARGRVRMWQAATFVFAIIAGGLGVAWAMWPTPKPVIQVVRIVTPPATQDQKPPPKPALPAPDGEEAMPYHASGLQPPRPILAYFRLQEDLLRRGLDALDPVSALGSPSELPNPQRTSGIRLIDLRGEF